jgi:hypothetical protein
MSITDWGWQMYEPTPRHRLEKLYWASLRTVPVVQYRYTSQESVTAGIKIIAVV